MRKNKLVAGLVVLSLTVGILGMVAVANLGKVSRGGFAKVVDNVSWTIEEFIQLAIDERAFDFGAIDPWDNSLFLQPLRLPYSRTAAVLHFQEVLCFRYTYPALAPSG